MIASEVRVEGSELRAQGLRLKGLGRKCSKQRLEAQRSRLMKHGLNLRSRAQGPWLGVMLDIGLMAYGPEHREHGYLPRAQGSGFRANVSVFCYCCLLVKVCVQGSGFRVQSLKFKTRRRRA